MRSVTWNTSIPLLARAAGPGQTEPWIDRAVRIGHLVVLLIVATVLRVRGLDRDSLWYDETVTMRVARTANPVELVRSLDRIDGTRAPLHPLILQGWLRLFGTSELAGRSLSAVCGIADRAPGLAPRPAPLR